MSRGMDGLIAKQVVVRLRVESIGIGLIKGNGVVILGEMDGGVQAVVVRGWYDLWTRLNTLGS
jgi:hypothetical protein